MAKSTPLCLLFFGKKNNKKMDVTIKTYAPVIITTLCRYEHFKRCVESLSRCTGAEYTELYIGLDYPTQKSHENGYHKIDKYIERISGFKQVHVFRRKENYGAQRNHVNLRESALRKFDRYIDTEDDNEFSPNFLEYINKGLELYKDNPEVMAICGYSYPFEYCKNIDSYPFNAYPIQSYCAWGVGYWRDKIKDLPKFINPESANNLIHSWCLVYQLFKKKQHITVHRLLFRHQVAYGDLMWRAYCALNNVYCIFPLVSKVRNWGFDNSGLNCEVNSVYEKQDIDSSSQFHFESFEVKPYKPIMHIQNKLNGNNWIVRRLCEMEYILYRITGISLTSMRRKTKHLKKRIRY